MYWSLGSNIRPSSDTQNLVLSELSLFIPPQNIENKILGLQMLLTDNVEPTKCHSIELMMQWMRIALQYSEKTWHQENIWMCSSSGIDEDAEKKWANQWSSNDARRQKVSLTAFDWLDAYELCWLLDDVLLIWLWLKYCKLLNASKLNLPIPNIVTVISANFYQWCNEIYHVFTNLFYFSKCFFGTSTKKRKRMSS